MKNFLIRYPHNIGLYEDCDLNESTFKDIYKLLNCCTILFNEEGIKWIDEHYSLNKLVEFNDEYINEMITKVDDSLEKGFDYKLIYDFYYVIENIVTFNYDTHKKSCELVAKIIQLFPLEYNNLSLCTNDEEYEHFYFNDVIIHQISIGPSDLQYIKDLNYRDIRLIEGSIRNFSKSCAFDKTDFLNIYPNEKFAGLIPMLFNLKQYDLIKQLFENTVGYMLTHFDELYGNNSDFSKFTQISDICCLINLIKKYFDYKNISFEWINKYNNLIEDEKAMNFYQNNVIKKGMN